MTNDFLAFAPISTDAPAAVSGLSGRTEAGALLDDLMARVGVDGLVAALADPGLLALIDQHAAAVRDSLADAGRAIDEPALASYARSILASARRMGRAVPAPGEAPTRPADWMHTDWHLLRLAAVCLLADEHAVL